MPDFSHVEVDQPGKSGSKADDSPALRGHGTVGKQTKRARVPRIGIRIGAICFWKFDQGWTMKDWQLKSVFLRHCDLQISQFYSFWNGKFAWSSHRLRRQLKQDAHAWPIKRIESCHIRMKVFFSREKRLGPRELVNICYFSMHCPARHRLCSFTGMTKEQVSDLVTEESCRFVPTAAEFNFITLAVSAGVVARSRICAWQPSVCIEQVRESMVKLCHVVSFILRTYKLVELELAREKARIFQGCSIRNQKRNWSI